MRNKIFPLVVLLLLVVAAYFFGRLHQRLEVAETRVAEQRATLEAPTLTPVPPTGTPRAVAVLESPVEAPTSTATSTSTATPTVTASATTSSTPTRPPTSTLTPTSSPTAVPPTATASPATATQPPPTATPSARSFTLLQPPGLEPPTFGLTIFEWEWHDAVPTGFGFEVRVWRAGEHPTGVHNAVLDNQNGEIKMVGPGRYQLVANIKAAPGVLNRSGEYLWSVGLVQIQPIYKDLGIWAAPALLRFEAGGSGGGDKNKGGPTFGDPYEGGSGGIPCIDCGGSGG